MTVSLLAVALCLLAAGPASAADDRVVVISGGQSDSVGLVGTAQSDGTDTEPGTDRRLVGRQSGDRVDAVVIALWTIAAVMTVLLGIFLWHTSPRRRLRLAGASAELFDEAEEDSEAAGSKPGQDSVAKGPAVKDFAGRVWERMLAWTRSRMARPHSAESVDDDSEQRRQAAPPRGAVAHGAEAVGDDSEPESVGEPEDESAVWKFGEKDGGERSV